MDTPVKKSAGRPPKSLSRKFENRKGIINEPNITSAIFELTHDNPDMFCHIFDAYKRVNEKIYFTFSPEGVKIKSESKNNSCIIITDIYGSRVISYYCQKKISYYCLVKDLILILKAKKKNHNKIIFYINSDDYYTLYITLISKNGIKETCKAILDKYEDIEEEIVNFKDYSLNFTLEWSYFKEIINSWKSVINADVIFTKMSDESLKISFHDAQRDYEIDFGDDKTTNLYFNSEKNNFIAVSIPIMTLLDCSPSDSLSTHLTFYLERCSSVSEKKQYYQDENDKKNDEKELKEVVIN